MNKDVEGKLCELIDVINSTEEVKIYKDLEKKVHSNQFIMDKFDELKHIQKKFVIGEHKGKNTRNVEEIYNEILSDFDDMPIIHQFLNFQAEINDILQEIVHIIEIEINV